MKKEDIPNKESFDLASEEVWASYLHVPVGLALISKDLKYIRINQMLADINGFSINEHLGKSIREVIPSLYPNAKKITDEIIKTGKPKKDIEFSGTIKNNSKEIHTWLEDWFPIFDEKRNIWAFNVVVRDITKRKKAEENANKCNIRFKHASLISNTIFAECDLNLKYTWINNPYADFKPESVIGKTDVQIADNSGTRELMNLKKKVIQTQKEHKKEISFPLSEGVHVYEVHARPIYSLNKIIGVSTSSLDITERKKIEEKLKISEEKYRSIIEKSFEGIWQIDDKGTTTYSSERMAKMLGYSVSEMIGKSFLDFMDKQAKEQAIKLFARRKKGIAEVHEFRFKHKSGRDIITRVSTSPIIEKGVFGGSFAYVQDITLEKKAEEELRKSKELAEKYLDIDGIIVTFDTNARITLINTVGCKILGYKKEELIGKNWFKICLPKKEYLPTYEVYKKIISGNLKPFEYHENYIQTKKGEKRYIAWHNTLLRDDNGNIMGTLSSGEDITPMKQSQEALKESEEKYRKVIESNPRGMHFYKLEKDKLIFVDSNKAADDILGIKNSRLYGKTIQEAFPLLVDTLIPNIYRKVILTGKSCSQEVPYHANGINGIFDVLAFKIGKNLMAASFSDITGAKKIENDLKEREQLIRSISNNLKQSLIYRVLRFPNGERKFTFLSESVKKFYGVTSQEAIRDSSLLYSKIHPQDAKKLYLEEEKANKNLSVFKSESRVCCPDGKIRWFSFISFPSKLEKGVIQWDGIQTDITEKKKAEEDLKKAKENVDKIVLEKTSELQKQTSFLNSVVANVPDMIFVKDASDLRFKLFNIAGEQLLGQKKEDLIGKNDYDFFPKKQADFFIKKDKETLAKKEVVDIAQEPIKTPFGERILHTKKIPILNEKGEPAYLLGISEDITAKIQAEDKLKQAYEQLKTLDKLKSEFLAFTSHELKTPLTPLLLQAQMLDEGYFGNINEEQKKSIDLIIKNMKDLNKLIGDLLDIAVIQNKSLKIYPISSSLAPIVNDVFSNMDLFAKQKSITLKSDLDNIPKLFLDTFRIKQVITNLVHNAIKFNKENGKIEVIARVENNFCVVRVIDNGIGISVEDQKKLFKPFTQLEENEKLRYRGTGLGLVISKGIVEAHGGSMGVKSESGKGSTFWFTLPLKTK
jgi:PAS domain S-box-containing protein